MPVLENAVESEIDLPKEVSNLPIVPVFSRVVIKQIEVEKVGSIYVPETSAKEGELQTNEGYILAIGEEVSRFSVGDKVYYGRYSGFKCTINSQKYRIMNEEDIIGVFKE